MGWGQDGQELSKSALPSQPARPGRVQAAPALCRFQASPVDLLRGKGRRRDPLTYSHPNAGRDAVRKGTMPGNTREAWIRTRLRLTLKILPSPALAPPRARAAPFPAVPHASPSPREGTKSQSPCCSLCTLPHESPRASPSPVSQPARPWCLRPRSPHSRPWREPGHRAIGRSCLAGNLSARRNVLTAFPSRSPAAIASTSGALGSLESWQL